MLAYVSTEDGDSCAELLYALANFHIAESDLGVTAGIARVPAAGGVL